MKIDETKALVLLDSSKSFEEKARVCDWLAVVGGPKSVPVLASYLSDPEMAIRARNALENIPDASAGDALTQSLGKLKGDLLIGVITSLGVRKETDAVPKLCVLADDSNQGVALSALSALGQIANGEAVAKLRVVLAKGREAYRMAAAHAALVAVESLKGDARKDLLVAVGSAKVTDHIKLAAEKL